METPIDVRNDCVLLIDKNMFEKGGNRLVVTPQERWANCSDQLWLQPIEAFS